MRRPARKPTLWPPCNVSTQISLRSSRRLTDPSRHIPYQGERGIELGFLKQKIQAKSVYPGKLMLVRIDTLRRVHNVGFLASRVIRERYKETDKPVFSKPFVEHRKKISQLYTN